MDEREEMHEEMTEGAEASEPAEDMQAQTEEKTEGETKPAKKRGCLGCLGNIIIVIAVIFLLTKGLEWLACRTNPDENNSATTKANTYNMFYNNLAGSFEGRFKDRIVPLLDKFMLEDDKPVVGNDEINKILSEYTLEDDEAMAEYTGRKVKLTGKIIYRSNDIAEFVTDVNCDTYSSLYVEEGYDAPETERKSIHLDCSRFEKKPDANDCVEVEGMLTAYFGFDYNENGVDIKNEASVDVREIREAEYLALGGNPADQFMYQKMEPVTSVEQKGVTLDILGASVDAATGRAYVKYQISMDEDEMRGEVYNFDIFGAKGSFGNQYVWSVGGGSSICDSFFLTKELIPCVEQVAPGENQISFIICGCSYKDERADGIDPNADIFIRVDIPSDSWTIVGQ